MRIFSRSLVRKTLGLELPRWFIVCLVTLPAVSFLLPGQVGSPGYSRAEPTRDGTGKFYLGREIAKVMGHRGASWLERPEREKEENPDQLVSELPLNSGDVVADVGAGTGYLSWRIAQRVGRLGRVYAVDVQPEMVALCEKNMKSRGLENVETVLGSKIDPGLPDSTLDMALMVDVYHEFSHPFEMIQAIRQALKLGGHLVFVEYRGEDPDIPIKPLHKMTEIQVRKEALVHRFEWVKTIHHLPRQHVILFEKVD